jgi:peroxiredoxin
MRTVARVLIGILILAAAGLLAYGVLVSATGTKTDKGSPSGAVEALFAASFPDQTGTAQSLDQWRGKVIVVNFWATWCPPCREEMPELSAFQDQFRSRNLVVLGISTDDVAKIREFAKQSPTTYPLLSGDFEAMALAEGLGNNKGILPYTVLLKPDGSVSSTYLGRLDMKILEKDVIALINVHKQL